MSDKYAVVCESELQTIKESKQDAIDEAKYLLEEGYNGPYYIVKILSKAKTRTTVVVELDNE